MAEEIFIPKLGQTVEEVTLIRWLVPDGSKVEQGQELLEVETDKAVFNVEATAKGFLHIDPTYKEGTQVAVLTVVGVIAKKDEALDTLAPALRSGASAGEGTRGQADEVPEDATASAGEDVTMSPGHQVTGSSGGRVFSSPRARKLAEEKGVPLASVAATGGGGTRVAERDVLAYLAQMPKATPLALKVAAEAGLDLRGVPGTGKHGTITREDVERRLGQAAPQPATTEVEAQAAAAPTGLAASASAPATVTPKPVAPAIPVAPLPDVEVTQRVPLAGIRKIIAERMAASVHTTARVTLVTEIDATEFVALRTRLKAAVEKAWGFAPGYNDLLAKIVAAALRKYPYMNARLAPDAIEHLAHINVGMAVDTERGLLVPVIRDADRKTLYEFAVEFRAMVERARVARSLPDDLSGGSFTITNLGMYDIDAFTPVINMPEGAILGVGRIADKVVPFHGQPAIRKMLTLSLVFDHRLVDGAPAARFLQYIKQVVEEPYLLLAV